MSFKKFFFLILFVVVACKPGVKNEMNKREVNLKNLASYSSDYPNVKPLLDALSQKYNAAWAEAEKITSEEEKAKKMNEANSALTGNDFYSRLSSFATRYKSVENNRDKLASQKIEKKFASERDSVLSSVSNDLKEGYSIVTSIKPDNEADAAEEVKKANGILISAENKISSFNKKLKGKK